MGVNAVCINKSVPDKIESPDAIRSHADRTPAYLNRVWNDGSMSRR